MFGLIAVVFLSYWDVRFSFKKQKTIETVKNGLCFKKIANFTGKLLQTYKQSFIIAFSVCMTLYF